MEKEQADAPRIGGKKLLQIHHFSFELLTETRKEIRLIIVLEA